MAPRTDTFGDFTFIMTCLKHTPGLSKLDFEKVVKELGVNGKDYCYFRHYAILKKWELKGVSGRGRSAVGYTASASGKKRGGPAAKETTEHSTASDELGDIKDSPSERKKAKMAVAAVIGGITRSSKLGRTLVSWHD